MKRNTVKPLHNGDFGDRRNGRCVDVAVMGRKACNMTIFLKGVRHVYCTKFMFTVSHNNNNPIIDYGGARLLLLWASPVLNCKTVRFFSQNQ